MNIVYSIIPKTEINDDLIIVCSHLFNTNYGKWSEKGFKPGENIKISIENSGIKTIKENMLFNDQCGIVTAKLSNQLVGYCFYSKFIDNKIGKICWITQLVVDKNVYFEINHNLSQNKCKNENFYICITKNVIYHCFGLDCNVCGLVSSHPHAIRALEKATGYLCESKIYFR